MIILIIGETMYPMTRAELDTLLQQQWPSGTYLHIVRDGVYEWAATNVSE